MHVCAVLETQNGGLVKWNLNNQLVEKYQEVQIIPKPGLLLIIMNHFLPYFWLAWPCRIKYDVKGLFSLLINWPYSAFNLNVVSFVLSQRRCKCSMLRV
jgi:hypothetical protein